MRTDERGKENFATPGQRRRRLSNITNLSLSASWAADSRDGLLLKTSGKGNDLQLRQAAGSRCKYASPALRKRQEIASLKNLLSEKEVALEVQAASLEQMQKEFFVQLRRQAQVNEEIIAYNSRLSKDGGQLRDQLKLLQHEYCQMTSVYRINQSELQVKLAESQELLTRLLKDNEKNLISTDDQPMPTSTLKKRRSSTRRHSVGNLVVEDDWNNSTRLENKRVEGVVKRSNASKRSLAGVASKETIVRSRATQAENSTPGDLFKSQHANRYSNIAVLEPMMEDCEDLSPQRSISESGSISDDSSTSCKSGKCASSLTSESNNSRQTSHCESAVSAPHCLGLSQPLQPQALKTKKVNLISREPPRLTSVASSLSAPHFSRRVNNSSTSEAGRPVRKVVENVASYREPPLNTKMRRPQ